jgi:hypothetical protein
MKGLGLVMGASCLFLGAGCASSGVTQQQSTTAVQESARPGLVIVYNFAGTADDLPSDSVIAGLYEEPSVPQTPAEAELGRQLGRLVATNLVRELNQAGIAAEHVDSAPVPLAGDVVIRGEFVTVNEGSRLKRMLIGFGVGRAELNTLVEAYQVTATGLTPLGSAQIESSGGRMPGMLVPIGFGAIAGSAATAAGISGVSKIAQEAGPESMEAAARRTAREISGLIVDAYRQRGWL